MEIRPFTTTDVPQLTTLLHRAYAELGAMGLNFTAIDQDESTTLRRASGGASWVAASEGGLLGTTTISLPAEASLMRLTAEARVEGRAWLNQLAVDPDARGMGVARLLRDTGFGWARAQGCTSIGLDTAEPAEHLVSLYSKWGFEVVDSVQWPGKTYRSVIMTSEL